MWEKFVRKYKVLVIVESILFLSFLVMSFSKEKVILNSGWTSEIEQQDGRTLPVLLSPGVYKLYATAKPMADEEYIYFDIEAETSTYKALRCDGGMIRGTQETMDVENICIG